MKIQDVIHKFNNSKSLQDSVALLNNKETIECIHTYLCSNAPISGSGLKFLKRACVLFNSSDSANQGALIVENIIPKIDPLYIEKSKLTDEIMRKILNLYKNKTVYFDENNLLQEKIADNFFSIAYEPEYREWYIQQAILNSFLERDEIDEQTKQELKLLILNCYAKAGAITLKSAKDFGLQISPISAYSYFRNDAFFTELTKLTNSIKLVPRIILSAKQTKECINRNFPDKIEEITSIEAFKLLIEKKAPTNQRYILDISNNKEFKDAPLEMKDVIFFNFKNKVLELLPDYYFICDLAEEEILSIVAFVEKEDAVIIFSEKQFLSKSFFSQNGLYNSIDNTKKTLLSVDNLEDFLDKYNLAKVEFVKKEKKLPTLYSSFTNFLKESRQLQKFADLSKSSIPRLSLYIRVTLTLLEELSKHNIDKVFNEKKLSDFLQFSYFRLDHAFHSIIFHKNNFAKFVNHLEVIQQEIQNILCIAAPFDESALEKSIKFKFTAGENPIVPSNLKDYMHVQARSSAMCCLSSILSAVEVQLMDRNPEILVLKNTYYESAGNSGQAGVLDCYHNKKILDGNIFNKEGLEKAIMPATSQKFDVFFCDFHHNISLIDSYKAEKTIEQVKALLDGNFLGKKATVVIDNTMNLEKSEDLRLFLLDPQINEAIIAGKLNLVILRSAQKFDFFGLDNYMGGITLTINDGKSFLPFDNRMKEKHDQLKGLAYQGLLLFNLMNEKNLTDEYRKSLISNNNLLFSLLPQHLISTKNSQSFLSVSKIKDKGIVFLDIQLKKNLPETFRELIKIFINCAKENNTVATKRSSFGFANTNFIFINETRCRFNIGLEEPEIVALYAKGLEFIQKMLDDAMKEPKYQSVNNAILDYLLSHDLKNIV